jgi:PBP1b-binding outer membrane lipoprotein LpoB
MNYTSGILILFFFFTGCSMEDEMSPKEIWIDELKNSLMKVLFE